MREASVASASWPALGRLRIFIGAKFGSQNFSYHCVGSFRNVARVPCKIVVRL